MDVVMRIPTDSTGIGGGLGRYRNEDPQVGLASVASPAAQRCDEQVEMKSRQKQGGASRGRRTETSFADKERNN
jgi:hypothetical protein